MATSPNFGWSEPDDTSLVKDGAAAMRTLGNAIDASMADLLGGTTGQVLAKASNTNMDFTWVAQDDSNAIQNAIVDAKGDLIAASANDTPARLAVGNNGETLVADSSTSTGLRYQVPVNANPVLNSAMQIWQRGTSGFVPSANVSNYAADRWSIFRGSTGSTVSRQTTSDTTNLPFIQYAMRVARDSGNTSTTAIQVFQTFESINSIPYAGKTITFSFYARAGANYSPSSSALNVYLQTGTGTDQNYYNGFTSATNIINGTAATLTTTWQRFTFTATVGATATQLAMGFVSFPTGTAGAADFYEVTGVQLEVGSVATPFKTYAGTIQGELAACQRYYWRNTLPVNTAIGYALGRSSTQCDYILNHPVTMRTQPTAVDFGGSIVVTDPNVANITITSASFVHASYYTAFVKLNAASGLTQGKMYIIEPSANFYIGFSGEL